jgi:gamma-glutamyltranspeptidase/glutathione hydrolase
MGRLGVKRGFYRGPVADAMVRATQTVPVAPTADHAWRPGLMANRDLERYRIKTRPAVRLSYFGNEIHGMGPPSSGASTVFETLNILQDFSRRGVAFANAADTLYKYLEASRLAYADRNRYIGDPSFVRNPIEGLLSNEYAAQRAALIGATAPSGSVPAGTPPGAPGTTANAATVERTGSTTHLSVADRDGNIVAYTFTIESTGGNGVVVPGYGFLLNNELTDFDIGSTTAANRAEGGKRPRSSMSPVIVTKGDRPWLTIGSPGGASIITTVGQTLVNRINLHMTIQEALAAPRASQRNSATTEAESAFVNSPEGQYLNQVYGERYRAPAGDEIGALTGIEVPAARRRRSRWPPPPRARRRRARRRCRAACRRSRPCARAATAGRRPACGRSPAAAHGPRGLSRSRPARPRSGGRCRPAPASAARSARGCRSRATAGSAPAAQPAHPATRRSRARRGL